MARYKLPPRQKMINLLYIVLIAMLAINISTDVLNGYKVVNSTYETTLSKEQKENDMLLAQIEQLYIDNPGLQYDKLTSAVSVGKQYSELIFRIDSIKTEIVRYADGDLYEAGKITKPEDLKTVPFIMLSPGMKGGEKLRLSLDNFREEVTPHIDNLSRKEIVRGQLATNHKSRLGTDSQWEKDIFSSLPVVGAITILSKIEQDIHTATGYALSALLSQVMNEISVESGPEYQVMIKVPSHRVLKGDRFMAQVGIVRCDSLNPQSVVLDSGRWVIGKDGWINSRCNHPGLYTMSGYVLNRNEQGKVEKLPFKENFQVIEPVAMVSPVLMNTLYAGYDNPLDITVSGVEEQNIKAEITNGTLVCRKGKWLAQPEKLGKAVVTLYAETEQGKSVIGEYYFKVKRLPDPVAYIKYKNSAGRDDKYWGVVPITKDFLMSAEGVGAELSDRDIPATFQVLEFESVFVNRQGAFTERVVGNKFSERQHEMLKQLEPGDKFYITSVIVKGRDGIRRQISSVDATVI